MAKDNEIHLIKKIANYNKVWELLKLQELLLKSCFAY